MTPGSGITINETSPVINWEAEGKALWDHYVEIGNYKTCYVGWLLLVAVEILLKENDRLGAANC